SQPQLPAVGSFRVPRCQLILRRRIATTFCEYGGGTNGCTARGQNATTSQTTLSPRRAFSASIAPRPSTSSDTASRASVLAPSQAIQPNLPPFSSLIQSTSVQYRLSSSAAGWRNCS